MKYIIQNREAGIEIDSFDTLAEAKKALAAYEQIDKNNGTYEENFYEIIEK